MRTSVDPTIKMMFTNKLSKTGNLTMAYDEPKSPTEKTTKKSKWGAVLVAEKHAGKVTQFVNNMLDTAIVFNVNTLIECGSRNLTRCRTASTRRCTKCAHWPVSSGPRRWSCSRACRWAATVATRISCAASAATWSMRHVDLRYVCCHSFQPFEADTFNCAVFYVLHFKLMIYPKCVYLETYKQIRTGKSIKTNTN